MVIPALSHLLYSNPSRKKKQISYNDHKKRGKKWHKDFLFISVGKNEGISSAKPQERQDTIAIHQYLWGKTLYQRKIMLLYLQDFLVGKTYFNNRCQGHEKYY